MLKLVGGVLAILIGGAIAVWVAYNVFVERQEEFTTGRRGPFGAFALAAAFIVVGGGWLAQGWGSVQEMFQPKPRQTKKKKRSRPVEEE